MVRLIKKLTQVSGFTSSEWKDESEKIPEWATKKHEFWVNKH